MAELTFNVRMDEDIKRQFDSLCADFGMTASTAFNIFARTVVRERKIPFEITAPKTETTLSDGYSAFMTLRSEAAENGLQDLSLDEITAEISAARLENEGNYR